MALLSDFNENSNNSYEFQRQNEQIFEQIMTYKDEVNSCYIFNTKGEGDYKVNILQPVVENAIYHGMRTVRTGGIIRVSASKSARNTLEIRVSDNGSGIPNDKLITLNDYINEKNDSFDSIGLRNVNRRVHLFCKDEKDSSNVGVFVESGIEGGTVVIIRISC